MLIDAKREAVTAGCTRAPAARKVVVLQRARHTDAPCLSGCNCLRLTLELCVEVLERQGLDFRGQLREPIRSARPPELCTLSPELSLELARSMA